jgi:phosphate uptake regulator
MDDAVTARQDLAQSTYDVDRAIDKLSEQLSRDLRKAVTRNTESGPVTQEQRSAIMRDVDKVLDTVYPVKRGAMSVMQSVIERHMFAAAQKPVSAAVGEIRKNVPDDLYEAMNAG